METPKKHKQEKLRLDSLRALNILDTLPEEEFDEIIFLASEICQTPIALFSLVDENRQWFKAKKGLAAHQTERDISFCGHAINSEDEIFTVLDPKNDIRFFDNPLVTSEPYIQFYAGVPVHDPVTHLPLGTLCVIDKKQRELTTSQKQCLIALKNQIQTILKNKLEHLALVESQSKIQEISQRQDLILEISGLGSWEWNLDNNTSYVDKNWSQLLGLNHIDGFRDTLDWEHKVHPEDRQKIKRDMKAYVEGFSPMYECVYRIQNAIGQWIWVLSRGKICERDHNGKPLRIMGTNYDLSQYKKKELIALEFQKLASIGGWELDLLKNELFWTEQIYSIYGVSQETSISIDYSLNFFSMKDRDRIIYLMKKCTEGDFFRETFDFITADKNKKIVEISAAPLKNANGSVSSLRGTFQDVTDRVQSEKRLKEAQEIAKIGSWEFDLKTQKLFWSTEHYRIFEISEPQTEDNLFRLYREKIHPEDIAELDRVINDAVQRGVGFTYNHRVYLDNGNRIKYVQGIGRVIKDAMDIPVLVSGTCQDLTEKHYAEIAIENSRIQATQASKLASLGEVAAGIAHEINNPLAIISGTISLLHKYVGDEIKHKEKVEIISKSIQRINKIVKGLKKFSRAYDRQDFKDNSLSEIVQEALVISEIKAQTDQVELITTITSQASVYCDAMEIEQVLVNLINNSIDAIKHSSEKWVKINLFDEGPSLILQVIDSGHGIPAEVEDKLFQPFFTTKPIGEGTGLGLSICKGILDHHEAEFYLNKKMQNTCFEVKFKKSKIERSVA